LFSLAILLVRGDPAKDAGLLVLRHENAVLRRNPDRQHAHGLGTRKLPRPMANRGVTSDWDV
jgi:hypothetical protein